MNDYYEVRLNVAPCSEDATDLLAGLLADIGYESFVPDSDGLTAYTPKGAFAAEPLEKLINSFPMPCKITFASSLIEGQDWNAEWEKNYFKPILIGDKISVHSTFHTDVPVAEYDIVIDPKMAFGTGHHATTTHILRALLEMDLQGKSVIDMGTGTGILAILAAMRGATPVTAIELDGFAYENALENVAMNLHPEIKLLNGDASALADVAPANVFIANINRNVILADLAAYAGRLLPGGVMLLSGFYQGADCQMIAEAALPLGLDLAQTWVDNNWACLKLIKHATES